MGKLDAQIIVRLPQKTLEELKDLCEEQGITMSEYVRGEIDAVLEEYGND